MRKQEPKNLDDEILIGQINVGISEVRFPMHMHEPDPQLDLNMPWKYTIGEKEDCKYTNMSSTFKTTIGFSQRCQNNRSLDSFWMLGQRAKRVITIYARRHRSRYKLIRRIQSEEGYHLTNSAIITIHIYYSPQLYYSSPSQSSPLRHPSDSAPR
jgi:hypothetical protein